MRLVTNPEPHICQFVCNHTIAAKKKKKLTSYLFTLSTHLQFPTYCLIPSASLSYNLLNDWNQNGCCCDGNYVILPDSHT